MTSLVVWGEPYPVIQINGQKIIGPCQNWEKFGRKPNQSLEIFISKIPHHLTEFELMPVFASIGPIWKFRLMMNFSGQNRGFAYLQYIHEENYDKAFEALNGKTFLFPPKYRVNMTMSRNICTLVLGGIDTRFDHKLVEKNIQSLVCVKEIDILYNNRSQPIFFIKFYNHRDTALSRRTLLQYLPAFGNKAWVRWGPH
ncbi:unnamed protein product [Hermetia illucens]|uniref:RRM domain-containing protein n=1 Tax=Hermetia illucens TaxID=343691 RepID=A0A7R8YT18_HERIL|nr:dead end protein homolog 1-like [Hermetia illucens]CAD7084487.1 unnamed protein product [Hermetia illucens]